jgi:hypothetical protein
MAKILRVSGIAVPVLVGGATHHPVSIGDVERAEDGTILISRRIIKETYKVQVVHQAPADGIAWKKLFTGEGQKWDFDTSVYGSKGLGPSAVTNSVQSTAAAKFGAGCCRQTATTGTISYAALPAGGTKWTVMFWRSVGGAAFDHFVVTSSGHKWLNGVRADGTSTTFLTVTTATGTVKLDAAGRRPTSTTWSSCPSRCPTSGRRTYSRTAPRSRSSRSSTSTATSSTPMWARRASVER